VARKRKLERNEGGCVLLLGLRRLELQLEYACFNGGKGKERKRERKMINSLRVG
jgi:hypothetical protein